MRTFFLTVLFVFTLSFSGCSDKETKLLSTPDGDLKNSNTQQTNNNTGNLPESATNNSPQITVPPLKKEMLSVLGEKQNDLDTKWFFSDTYYVLVGQPKKFFESEVGKGTEDVLSSALNTVFQMQFPIDYSKVERFTLASAPQKEITFEQTAEDGTKRNSRSLALRRINTFHLSEPIAQSMIQTIWKSQSNTPIESIKQQIGGIEYYNLLPSTIPTKEIVAGIHLADDRTIVIFIMTSTDADNLFKTNTAVTSAAVERAKRLDITENLLVLSASWEGISAEPQRMLDIPFVGSILAAIGNENAIKFMQNFRAINLLVNTSAQVGKPMLSARYDAIANDGATQLYELFLGLHVTAQTTIATIKDDDEAAATLPLSKEISTQLLQSIEFEKSNDTGFFFRIKKFDGFDTILKNGFADTSAKLREERLLMQKVEQLKSLADVSIQYDKLNKKFPQAICDADNKPLLSWRVNILPLIGQQELYDSFNRKESWDSPTNLPLVEKIPQIFVPIDENVAKGKTQVQRFTSTGTPLSDTNLTISQVKQPQTTLLLVQTSANNAIEWTKPDELNFEEDKIKEILGNAIIGTTFTGSPIVQNFIPSDNPHSKDQLAFIASLIKGTEFQLPATPQNHDHDHNQDHDHDHSSHDHTPPVPPSVPPVLPIVTPEK
ncbi:MAG: DUF1559 domain-containing protein [Planctomycetaceae bacterium]|jgi:hypothetical protein|nr:DUF1559 domain-containing protein [Planctomycetaceae bacterium]